MLLVLVFSGLALTLAVVGIYGVLAYAVTRSTAEIGIRLALGAAPARVLRATVGTGMYPVLVGLILGLASAFWLSRLAAALLFQVRPTDLTTYLTVAVVTLSVASAACYVPARRVLRIDPAVALKSE
jgi:putative ABC transport system permease protein